MEPILLLNLFVATNINILPITSLYELDLFYSDLLYSDLIFCRDCLVHLSFTDIRSALISIIKSESKYLMTTHFDINSKNLDIYTGHHRKLHFLLPPFSFPQPLESYKESMTENGLDDKYICLWSISDLKNLSFVTSPNE